MRFLLAILRPLNALTVIARELTTLRRLYEADLMQRDPPIWLVSEKPRKGDTEVSYMDAEEPRKRKWKRLEVDNSELED